jgi:hypothetical protein
MTPSSEEANVVTSAGAKSLLAAHAHATGAWHAPAEHLAAVLRGPVRAELADYGVLAANGADATTFLQSQLTGDVAALDGAHMQLAGYCTPKGRLIATFHMFRNRAAGDDAYYLLTPRDTLPAVLKRLSMFILRSKVKLADVSDAWSGSAVAGSGSARLIEQAFGAAPPINEAVVRDGTVIARRPDAPRVAERYLIVAPASEAGHTAARLRDAQVVDAGVWWWTQIDAGIPEVFAATQEKFVPQMINFEVLGGVNFKKGCYPGQEIVARSQYLGRLRRRMGIAHCDGPTAAGADVYAAGEAQAIGVVVMAAAAPEGGMDLLFERPMDRQWGALSVAPAPGAAADAPRTELTERPLPYALFDPTA